MIRRSVYRPHRAPRQWRYHLFAASYIVAALVSTITTQIVMHNSTQQHNYRRIYNLPYIGNVPRGKELAHKLCTICHIIDASKSDPDETGTPNLAKLTANKADAARSMSLFLYIALAIVDPQRDGLKGMIPAGYYHNPRDDLTPQEIADIATYIISKQG